MSRRTASRKRKSSEFCVAGWNDFIAEKHSAARAAFLDWKANGKPRVGLEYRTMKRTRAQFKLALRFCKNNENS